MTLAPTIGNYFTDKNVLITGGSGGLGLALAQQLGGYCNKVFLLDVHAPTQKQKDNVIFVKCDITNKEQVHSVVSNLPALDLVFNNAGVTHMSMALDTDIETFERTLQINLIGTIYLTQAVLPGLVSKQGHLVAISSVAGYTPLFGRSAYCASKHGLEGYCLSLASEYLDEQLDVTVVRPAYIKTQPKIRAEINNGTLSPGAQKKQSQGQELSPEAAAIAILEGVAKKKSFVYVGLISRIAKLLFAISPKLYMRLMTQKSRAEFD